MKLNKLLLLGAAVVSTAAVANAADVTVRYTGSTAFRASTMTGIRSFFTGSSDLRIVANNASLNSANQATFLGTVGGKSYLVQCSWSGSLDGVKAVADSTNPTVSNFITEAAAAQDTTPGDANHAVVSLTGTVESAVADVALVDSPRAETGVFGGTYTNALVEEPVGVIPFVWVRGKSNSPSVQTALNKVTNITSLQAQGILAGFAPLSLFTNNQDDVFTYAKVVGRNFASGTRQNAFVESGFGANTAPVQYTFTVNNGEITELSENSAPEEGYSSGSNLRTAVSTPTSASEDGVVFAYMGTSDAAGIPGVTFDNSTGTYSGAAASQILTFNGVPYSHAAVQNGSYPYWNYLTHMRRASLAGDKLTAVNAIKNQIINADAAVGGLKLDSMNVSRGASGQIISSNY